MISWMSKLSFLLLGLLLGMSLFGQTDSNQKVTSKLSLSAAPQGGFVIAHRDQMRHLIQGHTSGITLSIEKELNGSKSWHQPYRYPTLGFELFAANLGNPTQMGNAYSGMSYILLPLNKSEKFRIYIKPGIGIGYVTKIYDPETNSKNFAIGSKINGAVMLESGCEIVLSNRLKIFPGIRLTHFSNAAYQKPNLGYNVPSVFVGVKWTAREGNRIETDSDPTEPSPYLLSVYGGFGVKENFPPKSGKRMTYTLSSMIEKRISLKSSLAVGLDAFYNGGIEDPDAELNQPTPSSKKILVGAFGGYAFHLHRFRILLQAGLYIHDEYKRNGILYNRFGLRYKITERLEAGLHLKTHITVADHFELGLGYRF
ncbi:acyloxyacyl hydrolase [Halocola ammonii]